MALTTCLLAAKVAHIRTVGSNEGAENFDFNEEMAKSSDRALVFNHVPKNVRCIYKEENNQTAKIIEWPQIVSAVHTGIDRWMKVTWNGDYPATFKPQSNFVPDGGCRMKEEVDRYKVKEYPIEWKENGEADRFSALFQHQSVFGDNGTYTEVFAYCGVVVNWLGLYWSSPCKPSFE
ncbi:hypothetical protein RhiJN_11119 [Ceratobasidium sp. AG-Ba]|nr:hypothetical protein RhiJN_11119 [Ceratobasidium sp. AG-Ba]